MEKFNFEKWRKNPTSRDWRKHPKCKDEYCFDGYRSHYYYGECGEGVKREFCETCISLYEEDSWKRIRL